MFAKLGSLIKYIVWLFFLSTIALMVFLVYSKSTKKSTTTKKEKFAGKGKRYGGYRALSEEDSEGEEDEDDEEYTGGDEDDDDIDDIDDDDDVTFVGGDKSYSALQRVLEVINNTELSGIQTSKSQIANAVLETIGEEDIVAMSDSKLKKSVADIVDALSVKQNATPLKDRKFGGTTTAATKTNDGLNTTRIQKTLKEVRNNLDKIRAQTSQPAKKTTVNKESFINRHANSTKDTLVLNKSPVEWSNSFLPGLDPSDKYAPLTAPSA